jgi:hypothetical protein
VRSFAAKLGFEEKSSSLMVMVVAYRDYVPNSLVCTPSP